MPWSSPDQEPEPKTSEQEEEVAEASPEEPVELPPGWYTYAGGLRFYDGNDWTEHMAPPNPDIPSLPAIAIAVAGGMLIGWFLIWVGAQAAPDDIFWPVKFVVEELPEAAR